MLYYDRIEVSEGIDANKTSASKHLLEGYGGFALCDISKKMSLKVSLNFLSSSPYIAHHSLFLSYDNFRVALHYCECF